MQPIACLLFFALPASQAFASAARRWPGWPRERALELRLRPIEPVQLRLEERLRRPVPKDAPGQRVDGVLRRLYCAKGKRAKAGIGMWLCIRAYANGGIKHLPDAPEGMDPSVLDRAASLRWPIGKRFQERYGFLGMVHYERRTQQGWSRRMAFAAIARLFARNLQLSLKKNGIPATLAIASRLVPALFRKTLDAETAAAACYYTKMPRSAMQHAKRRHCALQYEKREKARSRTGHLRAGEAKRKSRSWAALIQERKAALPGAAGKRRTDLVARNSKRLMRIDSGYEARKSLFMRAYAGLRGARSRARQIFGSCMPYCL